MGRVGKVPSLDEMVDISGENVKVDWKIVVKLQGMLDDCGVETYLARARVFTRLLSNLQENGIVVKEMPAYYFRKMKGAGNDVGLIWMSEKYGFVREEDARDYLNFTRRRVGVYFGLPRSR